MTSPLARRNAVMASRYRAGESVEDLALDYRLSVEMVLALIEREQAKRGRRSAA